MTDDESPPGGSDPFEAVDSAGTGDRITVYVRDRRDGKHYRVHFRKSLHGEVRHDGGGGFKPARRAYYRAACYVAREYVEDVLGYAAVDREEWTRVNEHTARKVLETLAPDAPELERAEVFDLVERWRNRAVTDGVEGSRLAYDECADELERLLKADD